MELPQVKQFIKRELPAIMREDEEIRQFILHLVRTQFADKAETESRFDRLLDELRRDREVQSRLWAENQEAMRHEHEEQSQRWAENDRKWAENQEAMRHEHEEQSQRWAENDRKWTENQQVINQMLQEIKALSRKHDSTLDALGARWGMRTEKSFRGALKSILEESFGVTVQHLSEFDQAGYVFGRPDQVEFDLIIKDGVLIVCEIKSSMSRGDVYIFGRKVEFYEREHHAQANRKLVISPMVDEAARQVADKLGIEVYGYAEDVDL